MTGRCHRLSGPGRRGAAAVELALVLPLLGLLLLGAMDFARMFYHYSIVTNAARNGALYASDPLAAAESPYTSIQDAALADATDVSPAPTVSSTSGTDADGNPYTDVTVTYTFSTLINYPGIPNPVNLGRTVRVRVAPTTSS
jgi:Flp pilus assembly protein TadG